MLLAINTGSSTVKLALIRGGQVAASEAHPASADPSSTLRAFLRQHQAAPDFVAHRIVHGGDQRTHAPLERSVLDRLRAAIPLAPLHNPLALAWVEASHPILPDSKHVAVLDTAFFAELPVVARRYALPLELTERLGLWRYGFHGLAHSSMTRLWSALARSGTKIVTLQLGSGCSASAVVDGRPIDTSMGFSPSEGLVMGTRAGDLDSGLLLHLQREHGYDARRLDELLTRQSGLLGLAGTSDMREVLAREHNGDRDAALAVHLYCYRASKIIGSYAVAMGGLDGVVFGGGIGEHAAEIRQRILQPLAWLGLELDTHANDASRPNSEITHPNSRIHGLLAAIDEAHEMYRITTAILGRDPS